MCGSSGQAAVEVTRMKIKIVKILLKQLQIKKKRLFDPFMIFVRN